MPIEKRMFLCRLLKEMALHEASAQRIGIYDASTFRGKIIKETAEEKGLKEKNDDRFGIQRNT